MRRPSFLVSLLAATVATAAAGFPAGAAAATTGIGFARAPGAPFATGSPAALDVAVADFNGDHHPDLAVTLRESGVVVLDGDGSGGFHAPRSVFAGYGLGVVTADFNGDGHPDLAVSGSQSSSSGIFVLLGRGEGTFALGPSPASSAFFGGVGNLAVADFNRDGHPDIASPRSAGSEFGHGAVDVWLGDGHGGLAPAPGSPFPAGVNQPEGITTLDANGDGWPDVALSDDALEVGRVSVLLGSSSGLSPAGPPFRIGRTSGGFDVKFPKAIQAGDLDGDHKPDLVIATQGNSDDPQAGATLSLLHGNGAGGFTPMPGRGPGMGPRTGIGGIRLADLDGDGHLDVAAMVGGQVQPSLRVLTGDGHGNLTPLSTAFPEPIGGFDFAMADLNGDRRPDVVSPGLDTGTVDVLLNLAPSLQVRAVSLASVVQSGLPVTVGCSAACALETDLLLRASAARHRSPVVVGRATTRLRARGRRRIRVRLTSHGRALLSGKRRATLTVRTTSLTRGRRSGLPVTRTVILHR